MNKAVFLTLLLLSLGFSSVIYTVDTDRAGFSYVTVSLGQETSATISLPADANNFRIVGGSYRLINGTSLVSPGLSGITTFSFTSEIMTSKSGSEWKLNFSPPENSDVYVYMPGFATIVSSSIQPSAVSSENFRTVLQFDSQEAITIFYRLDEEYAEPESDSTLILAAAIIAAAVIAALIIRQSSKKTGKKSSLHITPGKKEMMETFNENDTKIVLYLLQEKGKAKRNDLERKTGISKSSLAMALNRLEKRKIIEIDRGATTHFVRLSEYFLKL